MAHSSDFPVLEEARATTLKGNILVYMAWCDLQCTSFNLITPDGGTHFIDVAAKCRALYLTRFWPKGKGMGR